MGTNVPTYEQNATTSASAFSATAQSKTVAAMSKALQTNDRMECLSLDVCYATIETSNNVAWDRDHCLRELAASLRANASLKSVAVVSHSRTIEEIVRGRKIVDDTVGIQLHFRGARPG
jgi:hypothetical protein